MSVQPGVGFDLWGGRGWGYAADRPYLRCPTPVYVILEGVPDSLDDAPFSIQFVRVPYDAHAELEVARALSMPELNGYEAEILHGLYRGDLYSNTTPTYHRRSSDAVQPA